MKCSEIVTQLWIQGLVQGVGFRPFIYRIAKEMGIRGEVDNRNNGVYIRAILTPKERDCFIKRIREEHPAVASIHQIQVSEDEVGEDGTAVYATFSITPSHSDSEAVTQVSPDMAVCVDCLKDRKTQTHRMGYPFINCTHCGPRFTIIRDLPYGRELTTMSSFAMCPKCADEYRQADNRRFHAQPIACNHCGPSYSAYYKGKIYTDYEDLLSLTCCLINKGEILAVKGIGGYHLICDALNEGAVARLREIKMRDSKPFAVMFRDLESLKNQVFVNEEEERSLLSWRRPIVLLRQINTSVAASRSLAVSVNPGMHTLGCLLPYMPVHYDWFAQLDMPVLVVTSGNVSEQPIVITSEEAEDQFGGKVSLILHHNREIYNRVDDSVVQICGKQVCLIRRSRGYVPEPFFADVSVEGILAFGAEKVNTFALGKEDTIIQSQYIGDLKNWETFHFYTESMERFRRLFRFTPKQLVCDLHPDYLSSCEAERMAEALHLPLLKVQHHHAHAAACMLEYGLHQPVLAIVMDGTGLGDDGKIWGSEFFLCDRSRYTRLSHLEYVPLPGGDKASVEPWRMAVAYLWLYNSGNAENTLSFPAGFADRIGKERIRMLELMMEKGINTPYTSSAGRLFDAVASLLGICDFSARQAEAPVLLEQMAMEAPFSEGITPYPYLLGEASVSVRPLLEAILHDLSESVPVSSVSLRFHITLAHLFVEKVHQLAEQTGISTVVISGGCFQNKLLVECMQQLVVSTKRLRLLIPSRLPCNDGGIAAGQMAIASAML